MKILLKIMYVGTDFCGYQVQKDAVTVQGCLCEAARIVYGCDCDVTGCSRTDSGVHANEFFATLTAKDGHDVSSSIPLDKVPIALSSNLPSGISVVKALSVCDDFHARYDVVYKEYIYKIWNAPVRDPFLEGRAYHYPLKLVDDHIERMNSAAAFFVGEHDFSSFMAQGSNVASTIRDVKYCNVVRDNDLITVKIAANGFLYNMVRIIAGTLLDVGKGKTAPEDIPAIIESKDRSMAGATAPACGLYLNRVVYK